MRTIPIWLQPKHCIFFLVCILVSCQERSSSLINQDRTLTQKEIEMEGLQEATLGAGCFWCVEAIFQQLKGVQSVSSGYTGGLSPNPTYKAVCSGTSGHAEVARVVFDPEIISFSEILEVFWATHDPTTLNRQGADKGTQYRSGIWYHNNDQKEIAERSKAEFAPKLWSDAIVTEITALGDYFPAEDYHQNYYDNNPNKGYCMAVINPKVSKFRKKFKEKLKTD